MVVNFTYFCIMKKNKKLEKAVNRRRNFIRPLQKTKTEKSVYGTRQKCFYKKVF